MSGPTASSLHPHEPEQPPLLDVEGRCLVCALSVARDECERLRKQRDRLRRIVNTYSFGLRRLQDAVDDLEQDEVRCAQCGKLHPPAGSALPGFCECERLEQGASS